MSKTFKALQRAAKERASRTDREPVAAPRDEHAAPPTAAMARAKAIETSADESPSAIPAPAAPKSAPAPGGLVGEMDSALRDLLERSFLPFNPGLSIGEDGWVHGKLNAEARAALLARHDLLHCLTKDEEQSFWFWASHREAEEIAERSGYRLNDRD